MTFTAGDTRNNSYLVNLADSKLESGIPHSAHGFKNKKEKTGWTAPRDVA
jgi:hypothetical protein